MEIREYIYQNCLILLDTETVPSGYLIIFNFLPDIGTFYKKWLGKNPSDL
ncbi:MAG: acetone carboxylase subunit gamma [Promethearchaeota archaeon]